MIEAKSHLLEKQRDNPGKTRQLLKLNLIIYALSIPIWFVACNLAYFLAWEDPGMSRSPTLVIPLIGFFTYPLFFLFACIVLLCAYFKKYQLLLRLAFLLILMPLMIPPAIAWGASKAIAYFEYKEVTQYKPPKTIANLAEEAGIELLPPIPRQHLYFVPDSVDYDDIDSWDGQTLVYWSNLTNDELFDFYVSTYRKLQYDSTSSGGKGGYWRDVEYELEPRGPYFCVIVATNTIPRRVKLTLTEEHCWSVGFPE